MRKNYILCLGAILLTFSCKSPNEALEKGERNKPLEDVLVASYPKEIRDVGVTEKVTSVITDYLKVPLSSIAISKILLTKEGNYRWMFLNVKTGANYVASSNNVFENVKIVKNKKKHTY